MEYLEGGSLQELMKTSKDNLDEHTTQWALREILKVCKAAAAAAAAHGKARGSRQMVSMATQLAKI